MSKHSIAIIPGDGIRNEVMPEGLRAIEAAAALTGSQFSFTHYNWSYERYKSTGAMMPEDGIQQLSQHDAIFLGAVGFPGVPDHISLWGLLVPIRREFDQYVNLRPVRLLPGIIPPLRDKSPGDIDFWVVRENTEGDYSQVGGMMFGGTEREFVTQQAIFTRMGCDRIVRYAFDLAQAKGMTRVDGATKSNGIFVSMPYWDSRFHAVPADYPEIEHQLHHIDILCARLVMQPERFRVIVATNLFGDIFSDLGPGVTGTIAVAPSANINPERAYPSMFEPVHGSAPDIAGMGVANPVGQVWSAAMMLEHLGETEGAAAIPRGIETVLGSEKAPKTRDLGGTATTEDLGRAIAEAIAREG